MKEEISGVEGMVEEMNIPVKENIKSKRIPDIKHSGNLGHYEKTKPKNNMNRRIPGQRPRKYFQQNHRRKFP